MQSFIETYRLSNVDTVRRFAFNCIYPKLGIADHFPSKTFSASFTSCPEYVAPFKLRLLFTKINPLNLLKMRIGTMIIQHTWDYYNKLFSTKTFSTFDINANNGFGPKPGSQCSCLCGLSKGCKCQ